jgi:hypothetical protein
MRITNLHDVVLLYDHLVLFDFPFFERWQNVFTHVNGEQILQNLECFDLFVGLYSEHQ